LDSWTAARQRNAKLYDQLFTEAGLTKLEEGCQPVYLPKVAASRHIYNQYVIRVQRRDQLQGFLKKKGIGTEVYYPVPMHMQECFAYLGQGEGSFPESERAARETVAIPVYPELAETHQRYVVECMKEFLRVDGQPGVAELAPTQTAKG